MAESPIDPRASLDERVNSPGREGLTGTAPADLYAARTGREELTLAPDGRPAAAQPAWRHDFPIDWPQDLYVERRDFLKFLVLTSLAFSVGQLWIAGQSWWRTRRGLPALRKIAALDAVPIGGSLVFAYPGPEDACVLVRLTEQIIVAYSQKCTHLSCAVVPRPELGVIQCPCHDGLFDLRSGQVLAGPPNRPLPRIAIEVRGTDIYATGVEFRS